MRNLNFNNPILSNAFEVKPDSTIGLKHGFNSGGYAYFQMFYTEAGGVLSPSTIIDNFDKIYLNDPDNKEWFIVGVDINYENHNLYDSYTGNKIEAAYKEI